MNSENDEKKLIEEEQAILDRIVSDMDKVSDSLDRSAEKYIKEWKSSKESGLGEIYAVILHAKKGLQNIKSEKKQLYQARDELYDTRAELYIDDDKEKTYLQLGNHTFCDGGVNYTTNWNRPICRPLWGGEAPEEYEFDGYDEHANYLGPIKCRLVLRRNITLRFTNVKSVAHVFPLSKKKQEDIITDILLQELYERRSDNEWRSIIRSIQKKQKEIVLSPLKENIVVQGCAGSGKTMIMFHRLPIVLMDYPKILQRNSLYVITPSETYVQLVNNMTSQLEISDIRMGVLNDYYNYCISKYNRQSDEYGIVNPTIKLSQDKEEYVYSVECINDVKSYLMDMVSENDIDLSRAYEELSIESQDKKNEGTVSDTVRDLMLRQQNVVNLNNSIITEHFREIRTVVEKLVDFAAVLRNRKTAVKREIDKRVSFNKSIIKSAEKAMEKLNPDINKIAWSKREKEITDARIELSKLIFDMDKLGTDEKYFSELSELSENILKALEPFGDIKETFLKYTAKDIYEIIDKTGLVIGLYYGMAWKVQNIEDRYVNYGKSFKEIYSDMEPDVISLQNNRKKYLNPDYYSNIDKANNNLGLINKNGVYSVYLKIMKKLGYEPDDDNKIEALSCSPYIYLQILYQYYGMPNSEKETLITIDEAQSVAPEEIRLIKNINGESLILNLFGDVGQHIEGTKGIDNWSTLDNVMEYNMYSLEQNYRNAYQITEFCNEKFNWMKMQPMNTAGAGVHEISTESQFISEMKERFNRVENSGISAIIVKTKEEANYVMSVFAEFSTKMHDLTDKNYDVHRARWNIMLVDNVKGLEFKSVVVLSGRMSEHEQYIAYTRALDELIVYKEKMDVSNYQVQENKVHPQKPESKENKRHKKVISPSTHYDNSEVREYFESCGLEVVDNRKNNGRLWVIGNKEDIDKFVTEAIDRFNITGMYASGKESKFRNGWCTKTKK